VVVQQVVQAVRVAHKRWIRSLLRIIAQADQALVPFESEVALVDVEEANGVPLLCAGSWLCLCTNKL
jgi:hypothetical protein